MEFKSGSSDFGHSCFFLVLTLVFAAAVAVCVYFLLPAGGDVSAGPAVVTADIPQEPVPEEEETPYFYNYFSDISFDLADASDFDRGLSLYREPESRAAVEWFYTQVTGNREVAGAVLAEAEKNDIPLGLAFSLAYMESGFNVKAVNRNSNSTVDRGLFQLNSNSFPALTETDFFDPYISAKYGMSHLRFCLNSAGNEVSALAMYNAGTGRVRSNRTPQSTLNYVGKIMSYQEMLDELFANEVASYYEPRLFSGVSVAYSRGSRE